MQLVIEFKRQLLEPKVSVEIWYETLNFNEYGWCKFTNSRKGPAHDLMIDPMEDIELGVCKLQ